MADTKKAKKPGIFKRFTQWCVGLKGEFHKIIWPDKEKVYSESVTVVTATVCLGLIVAVLDIVLQYGIKLIVG